MANSTIIYACTQDGLAIFNKPGTLPEWLPPRHVLQGQPVTSAWAEPGPPIRVAVVASGVLLLSENGGRTWDAVAPQDRASAPLSPDAPPDTQRFVQIQGSGKLPPTLIECADGGLRVSADGGATWQQAILPHPGRVTALARDPERRDRLYAATDTGYLFESGNRGRLWQPINGEPVASVSGLYVVRI